MTFLMPEQKKYLSFFVNPEEEKIRIDQFLKAKISELSRSRIQKLIEEGYVKVGGKLCKPSYKIKAGEKIDIIIPPEKKIELEPEEVPFEIIYEDKDIAVINKPAGLVVHPAPGHFEHTLVHGLLLKLKDLSGIGGKIRPGIVHRLDKDTSGIMVIAKNDFSHTKLIEAFKKREIDKVYLALIYRTPDKKQGKIEAPIGRHPVNRKKMTILKTGRPAITFFKVLKKFNKASFVIAKPLTGRTHQIRVHFSYIGHPVLGDPLYGGLKHNIPLPKRTMLHACKITFIHPRTQKKLTFSAPLPEDFKNYILCLLKNT